MHRTWLCVHPLGVFPTASVARYLLRHCLEHIWVDILPHEGLAYFFTVLESPPLLFCMLHQ